MIGYWIVVYLVRCTGGSCLQAVGMEGWQVHVHSESVWELYRSAVVPTLHENVVPKIQNCYIWLFFFSLSLSKYVHTYFTQSYVTYVHFIEILFRIGPSDAFWANRPPLLIETKPMKTCTMKLIRSMDVNSSTFLIRGNMLN